MIDTDSRFVADGQDTGAYQLTETENKFVNKTMKNIGLDVKLLKIGLQYAQLRATGGNFLHLFASKDKVKLEVHPSNYQNLTYLHAMVIE